MQSLNVAKLCDISFLLCNILTVSLKTSITEANELYPAKIEKILQKLERLLKCIGKARLLLGKHWFLLYNPRNRKPFHRGIEDNKTKGGEKMILKGKGALEF